MRSIKIDGIPEVTDYFDEGNRSYLVQAYIEGDSLQEKIKTNKLTEDQGRKLLSSLLKILEQLHKKDIIHRDIKPENIMVNSKGEYYLIDFGAVKLAVGVDDEGHNKTNIGTPGYATIEQMNGRTVKSSDIYALGMSVSEAITGVKANNLRKGAVDDINYKGYGIRDNTLVKVLLKMTEPIDTKRYSDVKEILKDLAILESLDTDEKISKTSNKEQIIIEQSDKNQIKQDVIANLNNTATIIEPPKLKSKEKRFIDNSDGTITDTKTGFMWQQYCSSSGELNWQSAIDYCKNLRLAGYSDWKVPTLEELENLIGTEKERGNEKPHLWLDKQGFKNVQSDLYWSNTVCAENNGNAWYFNMNHGYVSYYFKSNSLYVLAVRSGR